MDDITNFDENNNMKIRIQLLTILFILLVGTSANAQDNCNIPIDTNKILYNTNLDFYVNHLKKDTLDTYFDRNKIPSYISKKLYCLIDTLANPDENWQSTDVVYGELQLPWRRLMFLSVNKREDLFVVVYEKGGIGTSTIIIMMKLTDKGIIIDHQKNVEDIWIGQTFFDGKNIPDLVKFIEENRYLGKLNTTGIFF